MKEHKRYVESILAAFIGKDMTNFHIQRDFCQKFNHCLVHLFSNENLGVYSNFSRDMYVVGVDVVNFEDNYGNVGSQLEFCYSNRLEATMYQRYGVR